jgi:hypothetical protein
MKVDFGSEITDLKGKPLPNGDGNLTLGDIACTALINVLGDDQAMSGDDKVKLFRLAQLASEGGEQDVKVEDVALLKKRVAKMYGALVVGRVFDLLEG